MGIDIGWNDSEFCGATIGPVTYSGTISGLGTTDWNSVSDYWYTTPPTFGDILEKKITKIDKDMCYNSITVNCKEDKNDMFITIVNSLRENLNNIRSEERRVREKALEDKVDAEPSLIEVEALRTKYNSLNSELYKLEDYQFIKASRIKKARKALLEQAKETASKVAGFNYVGNDIDYVAYYLRRVFEKKEDIELGLPKYYTTDEIKARLYLTENWEEKSFKELVKLIQDNE